MSAMRNLNARELHGRNLRVDHATRDHGVDPKPGIDIFESLFFSFCLFATFWVKTGVKTG